MTNLNVGDCEDVTDHHLSVSLSYLDHDSEACHVMLVGRGPYSSERVGVDCQAVSY